MMSSSSSSSSYQDSSNYAVGESLWNSFSQRSLLRNDKITWDAFLPLLGQSGWEESAARKEWDQVDTNGDGALARSKFLQFASYQNVRPYILKMEQSLGGQQQQQFSRTQGLHQGTQGLHQGAQGLHQGAAYSQQDSRLHEQGKQTLQLAEEKLHIDKQTQQAGQAEISKHIETKQVQTSVPLVHEEFFIERRPVSDGRPGTIEQDGATIRIPLMREELSIQKQANVVEEVVIGKRPVQEQQTVNAELMRERLDVQNQQTGFQQQSRERLDVQQSGFQQQGLAQAGYTGPQGTNLGTQNIQQAGYTGPQGTNLGTQNIQQSGKLAHGSQRDIVG